MKLHCLTIMLLATTLGYAQTSRPVPALPTDAQFRSFDPPVRAAAIKTLRAALESDPRTAVTQVHKRRILWALQDMNEHEAAAELALACVNGQPDRVDRVEHFMAVRVKSLLALKKPKEALSAAKSWYNVAQIESTQKAIDAAAECLLAVYPEDPARARIFKLQQLDGAATQPSDTPDELGLPLLAMVKIDASLYTGAGAAGIHNPAWRELARINVALLQDDIANARERAVALCSAGDAEAAAKGHDALARVLKASSMTLRDGREYLESPK